MNTLGTYGQRIQTLDEAREYLLNAVKQVFPSALGVRVSTDYSHGEPHGHVDQILGPGDVCIAEGDSCWWRDSIETLALDAAVFDWYVEYCALLTESGFTGQIPETLWVREGLKSCG